MDRGASSRATSEVVEPHEARSRDEGMAGRGHVVWRRDHMGTKTRARRLEVGGPIGERPTRAQVLSQGDVSPKRTTLLLWMGAKGPERVSVSIPEPTARGENRVERGIDSYSHSAWTSGTPDTGRKEGEDDEKNQKQVCKTHCGRGGNVEWNKGVGRNAWPLIGIKNESVRLSLNRKRKCSEYRDLTRPMHGKRKYTFERRDLTPME